ncbi:Hsp70 family protein [Aeoliella sp.]|uniref:Hsp70 family protein n=1 Tax=Aeoliella sp. TaxID=2795800 RepID=UPI003CCC35C2
MPRFTSVGIDLGTTLSAVSYVDFQGETRMLENSVGSLLTPSVVLFEENGIKVGVEAWELAPSRPESVAENVKRDMGASLYRRRILDQEFPPEAIQGFILRQLEKDISRNIPGEYGAVITVPAYFDEARRKATADAGKMSGLPVLDIVNEPTAAALAFGERLGYLTPEGAPSEQLTLVVYDLGGGTFDVTVMRLSSEGVTTLATDGDYELGGIHWDERLADYAEQQFLLLWPQVESLSECDRLRLIRAARATKHELSTSPIASLCVEIAGCEMKLPVSRTDFEDLTADLVARTVFTTNQTLREADVLWHQIDRLLLVGGSTRMPAVRRAMEEASGLHADDEVHPDEAVARGAAIYARFLLGAKGIDPAVPKLKVTDVNSHGLGIEGVNQETLRTENVTIIPRNTPLPYEVSRKFVTKVDNQRSVKVQLLEGDSSMPEQCSRLAVAAIKNLPPGLPAGTSIGVNYRFEANGRLSVDARVEGHGTEAKIELERVRGLPNQKVKKWREIICRDGGYRDFEEAVSTLIDDMASRTGSDDAALRTDDYKPAEVPPSARKDDLQPAIPFGAPLAASSHLLKIAEAPATEFPVTTSATEYEPTREAEQISTPVVPTIRRRSVRGTSLPVVVHMLGHLIAGLVGLSLGYYALCWVRPDLNFLNLELPGINVSPNTTPGVPR